MPDAGPAAPDRPPGRKEPPLRTGFPSAAEVATERFCRFFAAASPWLGWIVGDEDTRARVLAGRLDPERLMLAYRGRRIVAFIGLHFDGRGPVALSGATLRALHGPVGGTLRHLLLGAAALGRRKDELYIESFKTGIGLRRRGYGSALLAAAEAEARRLGKRRIRLRVDRDNERARRLYQAHGYRIARTTPVPVIGRLVNHVALVTLVKDLGPPGPGAA